MPPMKGNLILLSINPFAPGVILRFDVQTLHAGIGVTPDVRVNTVPVRVLAVPNIVSDLIAFW